MISDLEKSNQQNKAYDYAMFLLGIRLRTEGEIREKLKAKKYNVETIDNVISRLKENRYIEDQRFAEVFLENLKKYKFWGYYGIKKKMLEKKLPMPIIESVLSGGLSEGDELEIAKRFFKNHELGIRNYEEKQKLVAKLAARGFRSSVISKLIF